MLASTREAMVRTLTGIAEDMVKSKPDSTEEKDCKKAWFTIIAQIEAYSSFEEAIQIAREAGRAANIAISW